MSELSDQVRKTFEPRGELYRLRRDLAKTLPREEWSDYRKLADRFEQERRYASRMFELEYADRVARARSRLIDEAGSIKRRLVPRFLGSDNFDKNEINRRAQNEVKQGHRNDIAKIDKRECAALRTLLRSVHSRVEQREMPIREFQKAVDRRSGQDRRTRSWER